MVSTAIQENCRSTFDTASTQAADGSITTAGGGSSHQFVSASFSFSGGGNDTLGLIPSPSGFPGDTSSLVGAVTESGSQVVTSDVTVSFVLDPNGSWRAANTADIETGETQSNVKTVCYYNLTQLDGDACLIHTMNQSQTDYKYNDHINTAKDINGVTTVTGTGSGSGSLNASFSHQVVGVTDGQGWDGLVRGTMTEQDTWTQNYAQNSLSLTEGSVVNMSNYNSLYGPTTTVYYTSNPPDFYEYADNLATSDMLPTFITFQTAGTPSYGQIGNPTVIRVVNITPVRSYGTVMPSNPNQVTTPMSIRYWQLGLGGFGIVCLGGAAVLYYAGYGSLTVGELFGFGVEQAGAGETTADEAALLEKGFVKVGDKWIGTIEVDVPGLDEPSIGSDRGPFGPLPPELPSRFPPELPFDPSNN